MNFAKLAQTHDKKNLASVLRAFPAQFPDSIRRFEQTKINKPSGFVKKVLTCGMGGSSLAVDIINNHLNNHPFVHTHKSYDLPHWVDENTLIFIASYSGNTEETLSIISEALHKTKHIYIITAGGKLQAVSEEHNLNALIVPNGIQPRCATGYFLSYTLMVMEMYGLLSGAKDQLLNLENYLSRLNLSSEAQEIATKIGSTVPVIYAADNLSSAARIMKIKFNEHAKTPAFWNVFPELNHNEMVGYTDMNFKPTFLLLRSPFDHVRITKRMDIFESLLGKKASIINITLKGDNSIEAIFHGILLGDWTAYYLALSKKNDPTPVKMVEDFKLELVK